MKKNLLVSIIQSSLVWEDVDKNLEAFEIKLKSLVSNVQLVVLPEMFASGFTMDGKNRIAERYDDVLSWMKLKAIEGNFYLIGSTIYMDEGKYYNRLLCSTPSGNMLHYDKRHLFTMGTESEHFTAGNNSIIINIGEWRIRPFICYDLRFPVWSRNCNDYDVAVYIANWPEKRRDAWLTLLKARAIENQAYVIGVNCVGQDGNKIIYSGDSCIHDPEGKQMLVSRIGRNCLNTSELLYSKLEKLREDFPVLNDADKFIIENK